VHTRAWESRRSWPKRVNLALEAGQESPKVSVRHYTFGPISAPKGRQNIAQGLPHCHLVKDGRPGIAFVPKGRLRLARDFESLDGAFKRDRVPSGRLNRRPGGCRLPSGQPNPARTSATNTRTAPHLRRPPVARRTPSGVPRGRNPGETPAQARARALKYLPNLSRPCGTKAASGLPSLTKWQWGLPWVGSTLGNRQNHDEP